ncbi:MAG: hypothetical protein ACI9O5_001999, partial [Algoriphagus sp.]
NFVEMIFSFKPIYYAGSSPEIPDFPPVFSRLGDKRESTF